jgi:Cu-Zn family superoxide dismutase
MKKILSLSFALAFVLACATGTTPAQHPMAMATLAPTTNQTAKGTVHFMELKDGGVEVDVDLTNVPPGVHGFHIHDKGDCGDDAKAAGPHFNPTATEHGGPSSPQHHAGDFGNVTADASGNVHMKFGTRAITVSPGGTTVVGHAVVLHGNPDDLTSQPAGNAGPRIACGVAETMSGAMQH